MDVFITPLKVAAGKPTRYFFNTLVYYVYLIATLLQSNGRAQRQQRGEDGEMFFEATNSGLGHPIGKHRIPGPLQRVVSQL